MSLGRFALILILALLMQVCTQRVLGQECDHTTDSKARFDAIRLLPPTTVTEYTGEELSYTYSDKFGVYVGVLKVDERTAMPKGFAQWYKVGKFWLLYSICDSYAYTIVPVDKWQVKNGGQK